MSLSPSRKPDFMEEPKSPTALLAETKPAVIMLTKHQQEAESLSEQFFNNWSRLALVNLL